ncbi:hypothetical protein [Halostagnicola sp. A-GB9-2]|uniref:hypothetical protein n=1 Tax=Halostagnicola sp. A-GB9-2 TaxID=3048066 RepID=UPI0024BFB786|nr:hypothetical protein [Halostagnicola sp. A-GB9-2]MDJ1434531.1 hypothetical protein [Halostagnicola sp. A-GB9-2]
MAHTYRTEPDPPEEPTECDSRDATETAEAFYDGIWVAVSSMFGVLFLVVAMIQVTRLFPESGAYGTATATSWIAFLLSALLLLGIISWGLKNRQTASSTSTTDSRGSTE